MSIGKFVKMDANTLDGIWKPFICIRVLLNVEKPLRRRLKIRREGDSWSWVNFKYERLGTFCFVCGILGHSERDCSIIYANPDKVVERAYGVWLRAPTKNAAKINTGARWLRNTSVDGSRWTKTGTSETTITAFHGGDEEPARFMEVDGVVRENHGDGDGIAVQGRDFRPLNRQVHVSNNTKIVNGNDNMESDKVVVNTKRKRTEENLEEIQERNQETVIEEIQNNEHLNLQLAGPGIEARLGL